MALVEIEAGPHRVTAAITRDAVEELGLAPGVKATATVKATSVMVERGGVRRALAGLAALALLAGGCGGGDGKPTIKVSAAASLKQAFTTYAKGFDAADVSFSFAGSDELAAQIRQGVEPDAYAAANTKLPDDLYAKGPRREAGRVRLQQARDRGPRRLGEGATRSPTSRSPASARDRVDHASRSAPTRATCSARLGSDQAAAIRANVRSNEPDVAGIVGKVAQGAVDAGFVYVTDVRGAGRQAHGRSSCPAGSSRRSSTARRS